MSSDAAIARACRWHEQAVTLREAGQAAAAARLAVRALKILERESGPSHPDVANVLICLACTQMDLGAYAAAEPLCRRAVRIMERATTGARLCEPQPARSSRRPTSAPTPVPRRSRCGSQTRAPAHASADPDIIRLRAQSLCTFGTLRRIQGRYPEAGRLFREALDVAERGLGRQDTEVASVLNHLGMLCKFAGRFAEAGRYYRRALTIVEETCGPEPARDRARSPGAAVSQGSERQSGPMASGGRERCGRGPAAVRESLCCLASLYHNLGGLEHSRGRHARGEPFARRSVELRQQALGPRHPDVAADKAALAALLDGQGKFDEAERLYREALAVFTRVYGPAHYEVAVNLNNLAAIEHSRGRHARAERLYRRAVAIKEKLLGQDHLEVAMTLNNLAVCRKAQGHRVEAVALGRRALGIFERTLGAQHPHTRTCRANLADLQLRAKRAARTAPL